jgi:hypothetical protein
MYNTLNTQELVVLITLSIVLLVVLIAFFNFDWLNNAISQFHNSIDEKHSKTKSGLLRFILAFFKYPGEVPQGIKHMGWKSGFTILSTTVSTILFGGIVTVIGIAVYYIVMAILVIAAVIIGIIIVFAILGAILSNS